MGWVGLEDTWVRLGCDWLGFGERWRIPLCFGLIILPSFALDSWRRGSFALFSKDAFFHADYKRQSTTKPAFSRTQLFAKPTAKDGKGSLTGRRRNPLWGLTIFRGESTKRKGNPGIVPKKLGNRKPGLSISLHWGVDRFSGTLSPAFCTGCVQKAVKAAPCKQAKPRKPQRIGKEHGAQQAHHKRQRGIFQTCE